VIVLSVGEPDFDTPRPIVEAAKASLDRGRTHYTGIVGDPPFARGHRAAAGGAHGRRRRAGECGRAAGAQCALFAALLCLLDQGEEIIVPEPMYVTYEAAIGASGAAIRPVALRPEHGFRLQAPMSPPPSGLRPAPC
jgi:Aspartate/tyrosine/aromatic aminotransferase